MPRVRVCFDTFGGREGAEGGRGSGSAWSVPKEDIATVRLAPGAQAKLQYVDFDGVEIVAEERTKIRGNNIRTRRVNIAIDATDSDVSMVDWEVEGPERPE